MNTATDLARVGCFPRRVGQPMHLDSDAALPRDRVVQQLHAGEDLGDPGGGGVAQGSAADICERDSFTGWATGQHYSQTIHRAPDGGTGPAVGLAKFVRSLGGGT
jgi:hypothetical protein